MKILILILSLGLVSCATKQVSEKFYVVNTEISEDGHILARPRIGVSENKEASTFMHNSDTDQLFEVEVKSMKKDLYTLIVSYCDDAARLGEEELTNLKNCSKSGNMKVVGRLNQNAIIEIQEENFKRKFKFNVSEVSKDKLMEIF